MSIINIQGSAFDSFVSEADANAYLLGKIGTSAWRTADNEENRQALVSATRWVRLFLAKRLDPEPDPSVDPAPQLIQDATAEAAFVLISDAAAQDKADTGSNVKRAKAGSAEVEFFRPTEGTALPNTAQQLLNEYLNEVGGGVVVGAAAFGVDGESEFLDADRFGRVEGFP